MSKALSTLAVGSKIEVPVLSAYQSRFGAKLIFKIADKNHAGYPANSVTLITEKIIQIMASDAKEPNNSNSDRQSYGNNRHIHSNILQWMNSNAAEGNWYTPKHPADQAPDQAPTDVSANAYTSWAGFLAMLEPKFVAELMQTTLTVVKASVDGGSYETFNAKMFFASTTEVGLENENNIAEGSLLALFSNDDSRVAYPTQDCINNRDGFSNSGLAINKGWYWWLRTPNSSGGRGIRSVKTDGSLNNIYNASGGGLGVRPLCNINSSILVSDNPNVAGNYEITYRAPVISGENGDVGTKSEGFGYDYTVTDQNGDVVNVVEKIDGKTIATKSNVTLGTTQTAQINGNTFTALTNGQHTLTVTATDSAGNIAVRTMTFTKYVNSFIVALSEPLHADEQPSRCNVTITRDIPAGGTFKVEVTNNPFDPAPVWENCTNAVVAGLAHIFTNKINTHSSYGLNIRVTVGREEAITTCWISGIGGNFE